MVIERQKLVEAVKYHQDNESIRRERPEGMSVPLTAEMY